MKALVAVKRVLDPYVRVVVKSDGSGVDLNNAKMTINPFDEIALEEALRLREKGVVSEIVVLSIGSLPCQETLRHALALGADRAIHVLSTDDQCCLNIAKIIQKTVQTEAPQLVLMGKQSIDGDHNQTPQMLAGLLDWPQLTYASALTLTSTHLEGTRETDHGLETLRVTLPAVISVDLRLNEPRYATLPNIMRSKQKPLEVVDVSSLGLVLKKHQDVVSVKAPPRRQEGIRVASLEALLTHLKNEANVL